MRDELAMQADEPVDFHALAPVVAERLSHISNTKRLLVLCHLIAAEADGGSGEASVGELLEIVDLSQSALSQHLARLRAADVVTTRREGQTIYYRLKDDVTRRLMRALHETFCADQQG